jgi:oxepin-CoA hydrolase/3-oxo-5,6-dehydrosuberyl-CoA semialdehyde dehydrogenase
MKKNVIVSLADSNYFPLLEKGELAILNHPDLTIAKEKMNEARQNYLTFFKENPDAKINNMVFGELNKYEWYLQERKHLNFHFEQFELL